MTTSRLALLFALLVSGASAVAQDSGDLPLCDNKQVLGTSHELIMEMVGDTPFSVGTFHFDQVKEVSMNGVIRRCEYPFLAFTGDLGKITFLIRASSNEQGYTVQIVQS